MTHEVAERLDRCEKLVESVRASSNEALSRLERLMVPSKLEDTDTPHLSGTLFVLQGLVSDTDAYRLR